MRKPGAIGLALKLGKALGCSRFEAASRNISNCCPDRSARGRVLDSRHFRSDIARVLSVPR